MKKGLISIVFLFFALSISAKIELPAIFTDNMVLQQQTDAPIWGKATPKKKVEIITSWDKKMYTTLADENGKWKTFMKTPTAGGPYIISISDGKKIELKNVLIGEVWICSGQSNMEMPLAGWGKVNNYKEEIEAANYPNIRLLQVDKKTSITPQDNISIEGGGWKVCSPATIAGFSSTAYFFGRNLNQNLDNTPIGLINTSWGGTIAEAWTSAESLENMPDFRQAIKDVQNTNAENLQQALDAWNKQFELADSGMQNGTAIWAANNFNDSDWKTMNLPCMWEDNGLPGLDGIVWFRKEVTITSAMKGKDLELSLGVVDDDDITYFNGEQVGATVGYGIDRKYRVPKKLVKEGKVIITIRVTDTGGGGGFDTSAKNMYIKSSDSDVISLASEWKYKVAIDARKLPQKPKSANDPNRVSVLYNAMIHPIVPFAIKGAIWYQGESNADRAYQYRELMPLMIRDWRKQWNQDFPFYLVQLANFMEIQKAPSQSGWAELREAQLQTLHLDNTGMAVTTDIGDAVDIHPKNKQDVGIRLALAARANTYKQNIVYSGPIYQSYKIEGNKIRISFNHTNNGLKGKNNEPLKGFAIAGSDHKFYWAKAVIEGNEIVVSAPEIEFPVAVRYAWANNPIGNLFNGAELPASPFRTDDWK